jgi:hemolysin activation/secretion protein
MNKITNYFTTIITVAVILAPINSFALTSAQEESARRQNEINQQRLERERSDVIKQQEIRETERIRKSRDLKDVKDDDLVLDDKGGCIKLNDISITGNTIFSNKKLKKKILKKYQDRCLKKSDILSVKQDLENYYISRGYSNARVYFDNNQFYLFLFLKVELRI